MAVHTHSVNTLETARVQPFPHSAHPATDVSLPLTFLDLVWLKFQPVQRVFFYRVTDLTRSDFDSVILPRLKIALSLTLLHYLPLAGRLIWDPQEPKPHISYSPDDAVLVKVAESDTDMAPLSSDEPRRATLLHPLVPELEAFDESSPIITLQVTFCADQGFCMGITAHHAVLDGATTTMFIKAWAYMCRTETTSPSPLPEDLTPFFDRTVIKDPNRLEAKWLNYWKSLDRPKSLKLPPHPGVSPELLRATFELTREHINKLRDRVKSDSQDPSQLRLSPFVLTYAHMLTCLVRARGGDGDRPVAVGFVVDYRTRFDPPVPSNYFGNCVGAAFNFETAGGGYFNSKAGDFMGGSGFLAAVEKTSGMVSSLDLKALEKLYEVLTLLEKVMNPSTQVISVSGSNRFRVYESDFGWGRPEKVEIVSIDTNQAMSIAESRDGNGGGVEIGMCLERCEMQSFSALFWDGLKGD